MSLPLLVVYLEDCRVVRVESTQPCRVLIMEDADSNGYAPEDRSNYFLLPSGDYFIMTEEFDAEVIPSLPEDLQRLEAQQHRCPRCCLPLAPEEREEGLCFFCSSELEDKEAKRADWLYVIRQQSGGEQQ